MFFYLSVLSQEQNEIDSLKTVLKNHTKHRSIILNKIADKYFYISNDSSKQYAELAYRAALKEKNITEQALALNLTGLYELVSGLNYSALNYFFRALKLAKKSDNKELMLKLYNNIGVVYIDLSDYEKAEKYLDLALHDNNDINMQGNIFNNLGLINHNVSRYDKALVNYKKALEVYKKSNDTIGIATAIGNMGRIYREKEDYDNAVTFLHKSRKLYCKKNDKLNEATVIMNLGITFIRFGFIDSALYYFNKSLEMSQKNNYNEISSKTYFYFSELYENMHEYDKALKYYMQYHNLNDSLKNVEKQKQITEANIKYETEKMNKTIELLNKDNQIRKERIAMQNKWLTILVLLITAIIIFTILIYFMKRRLYKSDISLVNKNIELAEKEKK